MSIHWYMCKIMWKFNFVHPEKNIHMRWVFNVLLYCLKYKMQSQSCSWRENRCGSLMPRFSELLVKRRFITLIWILWVISSLISKHAIQTYVYILGGYRTQPDVCCAAGAADRRSHSISFRDWNSRMVWSKSRSRLTDVDIVLGFILHFWCSAIVGDVYPCGFTSRRFQQQYWSLLQYRISLRNSS